jgi:hypothetical protein
MIGQFDGTAVSIIDIEVPIANRDIGKDVSLRPLVGAD